MTKLKYNAKYDKHVLHPEEKKYRKQQLQRKEVAKYIEDVIKKVTSPCTFDKFFKQRRMREILLRKKMILNPIL